MLSQVPSEFYYVNALTSTSNSKVTKIIQDDYTGDYIVAGIYQGGINLDPNSNTVTHTGTGALCSYIAMYDMYGEYLWSISLEGSSGSDTTYIKSIDVDDEGYIYAVGYYTNSLITSYPATSVPHLNKLAIQSEGFVARINPYNSMDTKQFLIPVGNTTSSIGTYVNDCKYAYNETRPTLILGGKFKGNNIDLNLDNSYTSLYSSTSSFSAFITAITADSAHTTSTGHVPNVIGTITSTNISIEKLSIPRYASSSSDTIRFAAVYSGTTISPSFTSTGNDDILLGAIKVDLSIDGPDSLNPISLHYGSIGGSGNDGIDDMIWDPKNNHVLIAGNYNGPSIDIDPTISGTTNLGTSTNVDAFIAEYNSNFNLVKGFQFSGSGHEKITSIALWNYASDTLLIGGYFTGNDIKQGSTTLHTNTTSGTSDGFMNLIANGTIPTFIPGTGVKFGSTSNDFVNTVAVSFFGEAVAGGAFTGTVDFDNSTGVYEESALSGYNAFMCLYGEDLSSFVDSYTSGDTDDEITGISIDEKGDAFAIGTYTGSINIGTNTLNSSGGTDVFIQRKKKNGNNEWAFNAGRLAGNTIGNICSKINGPGNDKGKGVVASDSSVYIAFTKNDTAYTQRINKNTGGPVWSQKINQNGSNIGEIIADAHYVYIVADSAGVQMTQRINKNTGGPVWSQKTAGGGKSKAITQDQDNLYVLKDSSGYTVVSRINKNTGGPVWSQRVGGSGADSIKTLQVTSGNDIYIGGNTQGGTFGASTASAGVFLVRLSVDSLDKTNSILPLNIQSDAFDCQIYPNPTHDMFNISAVLPKTELVQIRMVDLRGKIVLQEVLGNQNSIQNTIDIGELSNGVYILQIQAGNKQVIRKVIKQ